MAAASTMESELRCPVCNDFYRDPAMLQCAHHVCMAHLGSVSSRERLACPVCSDVTCVPEGGLQVDRVLQVLASQFAQRTQGGDGAASGAVAVGDAPPHSLCGFCEEKPATRRCVQCAGVLCEECVATSHSKGFFKSHNIVVLEEGGAAEGPAVDVLSEYARHMFCEAHPEEKLNFYCLDCRRPVCSHCLILGDHKGHQQTPIDQAFETGKETLGAWVEKLSQRISAAEDLIERLRGAEQEVNRGAEAQRNVINNEMDHLREIIETKRHQLLSRSALEEKQKRVQLQAQVDRAEVARSEANNLVGRSQGLLSLSSEHAFLAVVLPLIQDMKKCAGQIVDAQPQVSCAFRPLSTDAQVRSLGDLDLGHGRHLQAQAQPQVLGSVASAAAAVVAGGHLPAAPDGMHHSYAALPDGMQQSYGVMPPNYVANATMSYLQPQQAVPTQQVQYVYRTVPAQ